MFGPHLQREGIVKTTIKRILSNCLPALALCAAVLLSLGQASSVFAQTTQEIDLQLAKLSPKLQPVALSMALKSMRDKNITKSNSTYAYALRKLEQITTTSPYVETVMVAASTLLVYDPGNRVAAAKIDSLARSGNAEAQYFLGILYRDGSGGRVKDPAKSHAWMLEAGKRGHPRGAFEAGQNYFFGQNGQVKNQLEGFKWFLKSAEAGHPPAQFNVAMIYFEGKLVKQDVGKFLYWMQKAADGGDAKAKQVVEAAKKNGLIK